MEEDASVCARATSVIVSNGCTPMASFSEANAVLLPRDALIREEERDLGGGAGTLGCLTSPSEPRAIKRASIRGSSVAIGLYWDKFWPPDFAGSSEPTASTLVVFTNGVAFELLLRSGASAWMILLVLTARMSLEDANVDAETSAGPRRILARG